MMDTESEKSANPRIAHAWNNKGKQFSKLRHKYNLSTGIMVKYITKTNFKIY